MSQSSQVAEILDDIETMLKGYDLWSLSQPSVEALSSQQPFCCDTLSFEQWLQFILLPRMRAMLDAASPLPTEICICPMAEEAFRGRSQLVTLIERIADLDETLSGKRVRES